ncbi:MAG: hypothetical protein HN975_16010 [Anaerolineae bacterium]|jgi:metal-responsive CopG/Arc/MetJ family transcriptional regulator|nr:hypothetical protein [Anaerolineae bacterium]
MAKSKKKKPGPSVSTKKIRIQVLLDEYVLEKVDEYAAKYKQSRSYFCARAIEDNVTVDAYLHDLTLSPIMKPVVAICRKLYGEKNKTKRKEYMAILDHMTRENIDEMDVFPKE